MDTTKAIITALKYLPALVRAAEGLFAWKEKSGEEKKAWVEATLELIITGIATESTGGQARTWEMIRPAVAATIDVLVGIFNLTGIFGK